MPVRHTSVTPTSLAARRSKAQKSTGPRTARGRGRVCLNARKDGRHAVLAARAPRLRQAIGRKMRFTVTRLKARGLGEETKPTRLRVGRKSGKLPEKRNRLSWNLVWSQGDGGNLSARSENWRTRCSDV